VELNNLLFVNLQTLEELCDSSLF